MVGPALKLIISIDVEEEGLFSGEYPRTPPGVSNVAQLKRLEFIPQEFGFPLTLLTTYQVARDPAACRVLAHWRDHYGAEIGAHLHHWNTPPFAHLPEPEPVRSEKLPLSLLREKFQSLLTVLQEGLGVIPRSFRMGRFDWGPKVLSLLPEFGLKVDSSMRPLTQERGGPDHFLVPADPFYLPPAGPGGTALLEAPLTLVPVWAGTPQPIYRLSSIMPGPWGELLRSAFHYLAVMGPQPTMYALPVMRWSVRRHRQGGGQVLNMYFHSSELLPGANPLFPTEAAVSRLVRKIRKFLEWLVKRGPVQGVTLGELYTEGGEGG
ncbi:MAG: hypothetical protein A2Y80_04315 [Deltaproteobacteria bacterium RBG_13_58_19]|nr:MAG: hypothetical protein A2Y80_04315 [Deltaproteobacteria bacterium RBG_13_58_19]